MKLRPLFFWGVMRRRLVIGYRRFDTDYRFPNQSLTFEDETEKYSDGADNRSPPYVS